MKNEDLEQLIDHYPGSMIISDIKGNILAINSNLAKIFGRSRDELINTCGYSLIEANVSDERKKLTRKAIEKKKPVQYVDFERGHWWRTLTIPVVDESQQVVKLATYVEDITKEKKQEILKIKNKDIYFESLIEHSMDLITIVDEKGNVKYHSPAIKKLLGYEYEERFNKNLSDTIDKDDHQKLRDEFKDMYSKQGFLARTQARFRHKDGSYRLFDLIINNQLHNPNIKGFIINSRDITDLELLQQTYKTVINDIDDSVFILNKEGNIEFINASGLKKLEKKPNEILHKNFNTFASKESQKVGNECFKQALQGNTPASYIVKYSTKNNEDCFVEIQLNPLFIGGEVTSIIGVSRDITQKEKTRLQLIEQKQYLESIMNSAQEIIFTIDQHHTIKFWNTTAEHNTGVSARQVLGKSIMQIDCFDNKDEIEQYLNNTFQKKQSILDDIIIKNTKNQTCLWRAQVSPILSGPDVIEIVFICRDITFKSNLHTQILPGESYFISNLTIDDVRDIFLSIIKQKKNGYYITRNSESVSNLTKRLPITIDNIGTGTQDNVIHTPNDIVRQISSFIQKKKEPVILLDRLDYLISQYGFQKVLHALYEINDYVKEHNAIFFVHINRMLLSREEYTFLTEEFNSIASQKIDEIHLPNYEYQLLEFISQQNKKNNLVNQKHICQQFQISKATAQKRIEHLEVNGLLYAQKQGRAKNLYLTENGKEFLQR